MAARITADGLGGGSQDRCMTGTLSRIIIVLDSSTHMNRIGRVWYRTTAALPLAANDQERLNMRRLLLRRGIQGRKCVSTTRPSFRRRCGTVWTTIPLPSFRVEEIHCYGNLTLQGLLLEIELMWLASVSRSMIRLNKTSLVGLSLPKTLHDLAARLPPNPYPRCAMIGRCSPEP